MQESLRQSAERSDDPIYPTLSPSERRASEGGFALQLAGALYVSGRHGDASRALARAAELLPRHLVRDAEEDSTAAEVWFPE